MIVGRAADWRTWNSGCAADCNEIHSWVALVPCLKFRRRIAWRFRAAIHAELGELKRRERVIAFPDKRAAGDRRGRAFRII